MKNRKLCRALFSLALCIALLCGMFVSAEELIPADEVAANDALPPETVTGLDDLGDIDDLSDLDGIPTLDLDPSLSLDGELIFIDSQSPAIEPQPEAAETGIDAAEPGIEVAEPDAEAAETEAVVAGSEAGVAEPEAGAAEPETESEEGELPAETEEAQMDQATTYTVIFLGDDGEALQTKIDYAYNEKLEYICTPPTKAADAVYQYVFDGWVDADDTSSSPTVYANDNLPNVTADKTYKAHFVRGDYVEYTVTFVNDDDKKTELWSEKFHYNDALKYGGSTTPTKADDLNTYTFTGWVQKSTGTAFKSTDTLPNVTANETYTAKYDSTPKAPVVLEVRYEGQSPLTKVYDCNKYGVYTTKDGELHVLIDQWQDAELTKVSDIRKKLFSLYGSAIKGHTKIGLSLTGLEQFSGADVGDYEFKFTFNLTGDDAAYYTLKETTVTVPARILQREVVVTPRTGLSKTYGAKDPVYKDGSWLDSDTSSPLHQDVSGLPAYAVPVNTVDGKTQLTVTNAAYIKEYARQKRIPFFNAWLTRKSGEEPGKYRIELNGMSFGPNFKVTLAVEYFTITKKNIADANVTATIPNQKYTGKAIEVSKGAMVVKYNGKRLLRGVDYKVVSYSNNKSVSTASRKASVKIQGIGKRFTGTKTIEFSIVDTRIAITSATAIAIADKTYTGKPIKPAPVLKYKGKTLKKGTDYTLAYANNKAIGKATITVTGKGKYKGSRKLYFNIVPKGVAISKLTAGTKQATLTWKKGSGITGYQIEYHIYNNSKSSKKLNIKGLKTTSRTISGLTSKKTYVFKIRTYKTVNGKNYYSAWSKSKTIKVK